MTWARALGLLAAAYVGLILATALAALSWRPVPDISFLVALYAGLHCRLEGGGGASALLSLHNARPEAMAALGAALGYLADLVGGAPIGLHALSLSICLLLLRAVSIRLLVRGVRAVMVVTVLALFSYRLVLTLSYALFGLLFGTSLSSAPLLGFGGLGNMIAETMVTAACAPPVFALLSRLDGWLWRDPRGGRLGYESAR